MKIAITNFLKSKSSVGSKFYAENEKNIFFLLIIAAFFLSGKVLFHFIWNDPYLSSLYNEFNLIFIDFILYCSAFLLDILQYNIEIDTADRILRLKDAAGFTLGEPSIGYELTTFFSALIISCSGSIRKKIWFIPLGIAVIYMVNLLLICGLNLLVRIDSTIWELNHKIIFSLVVYSFIFFMWGYWIKINSKKAIKIITTNYRKV